MARVVPFRVSTPGSTHGSFALQGSFTPSRSAIFGSDNNMMQSPQALIMANR
jgi:hypothetical protein